MDSIYYLDYSDCIDFPSFPFFKLLIPYNEENTSFTYLLYTLDSICILFNQYFPLNNVDLSVAFPSDLDSPMCLREQHMIFLITTPTRYSQAAYQFAHELCHYVIPNDVVANLRWFEESLCEMASYYFLKQLTKLWDYNKVPITTVDGKLYCTCFSDYVDKDIVNAVPFDIHDTIEIKNLELDCEIRNKNKYIASLLLPIFMNHPETWMAVPLISSIPGNMCITESLVYWNQLSLGGIFNGISEIVNLFSLE